MAPTLKEVDAIELKAAASAPARAAAVESERVGIAVETASSGMPPVNQDHATVPPAAVPSPPVRQSATTTIPPTKPLITPIERENPNDIPPDESAFLIPPHFSRNNPFHRNLANLDLAMRCAICSELYHAPVTLIPCMHAFCSLCVRAHFKSTLTGMKRKVDCPKCNEPVRMPGSSDYEKGILPNKQLEQLVDAYTLCRNQMRESLVQLDILMKEKSGILSTKIVKEKKTGRAQKAMKHGENLEDREVRSSKRFRTMATKADYSSDSDMDDDDDDYGDQHNLKILASQGVTKQMQTQGQHQHQLKRKPTVNYHSMKKKQLVELCQKEGLYTHGNDSELKKRHSDFITLYNSECDSAHPRSVGELLEEFRNREMTIRREAVRAGAGHQSALMRNLAYSLESRKEGDHTMATTRNPTFDAKMNNNFAEMIATLKKQREARASSSSDPVVKTEEVEEKVGEEIVEPIKSVDRDTAIKDMTASKGAEYEAQSDKFTEPIVGGPSSSSHPVGTTNEDKQVVEVHAEPSVGRDTAIQDMPTCKDATFDAPLNNFMERIEGRASLSSRSVGTATAVQQVDEENVEPIKIGRNTASHNMMSTTSFTLADYKRIYGSPSPPMAIRQTTNCDLAFAAVSESTKHVVSSTPRYTYTTQPKSASRISSLGPWVCRACTFNNLRNLTKKARCEMCNAVRPIELGSGDKRGAEVVNIEC